MLLPGCRDGRSVPELDDARADMVQQAAGKRDPSRWNIVLVTGEIADHFIDAVHASVEK